jgi:DNA-binding IclR family transcriptional regulator
MKEIERYAGAQTVDRACMLLKEIARHGAAGARLVDLTGASGLARPTVQRILQSLMAREFIFRPNGMKRYKIGVEIYGLGLSAQGPIERLAELRALIEGLAGRTGDTVHLGLRRGDEVLCVARAEGATPIRAYLSEVGALKPIGATILGIALLAALEDDEVKGILRRTTSAMASFRNATPQYARQQIACVRRDGFCISNNVFIEGATGISAAVPSRAGLPCLAVGLSAIASLIPESRVKPLVQDILRTCAEMAKVLNRQAD